MSFYSAKEYETFSVSVFTTTLSPPEKSPAESKVPAVLSTVDTAPVPYTRKQPLIVPAPVIAKASAADNALLPADAADHTQVLRPPEYVGALVIPASVHPACEAIVSAAAIAE
jgi:hypothetical protein